MIISKAWLESEQEHDDIMMKQLCAGERGEKKILRTEVDFILQYIYIYRSSLLLLGLLWETV